MVTTETAVVRDQLRRNGVGLLVRTASFVDDHTLRVVDPDDGERATTVTAQHVVIAVGTGCPPGPGRRGAGD